MEYIFENMFVCDKWKDEQIPLIIEELDSIPRPLLKFIIERGFKIYLPRANNTWFFARNGLFTNWNDVKKRNILETPYASVDPQCPHVSLILDWRRGMVDQKGYGFIKAGYPHSVALHECLHVVDALLGLHQNMPPREPPLDHYAALNDWERFAVAAEAYCHPESFTKENTGFRHSRDWCTHNKLELWKTAPETFKYLEQFFANWEAGHRIDGSRYFLP